MITTTDAIAEANRLEAQAKELRLKAFREASQREWNNRREFEQQTGIDLGVSDDYANFDVGERFWFYYGYEFTVPPKPDEDEDAEWAFVAKVDGKEVMRMATSELTPVRGEEPMYYLLVGIAHWLLASEVNVT